MLEFLLVLPDRAGEVVDCASLPDQLDFSKIEDQIRFEVRAYIEDAPNPTYPVAAVDLTGYKNQVNWVIPQLCEEINFRRAFPHFEEEIQAANGPLIAFGESNISQDGFIN